MATSEPDNPPTSVIEVDERLAGERLDRLVAQQTGISRRVARHLIATGRVWVGNQSVRVLARKVRPGHRVRIFADAPEQDAATQPSQARLQLVYWDRYIAVVDKPAGLLSEPDRSGAPSVATLVPKLLRARGEPTDRVWLVHRLDAQTSGVMVIARRKLAVRVLGDAFRRGEVSKGYLALCNGGVSAAHCVDAPIARRRGIQHGVSATGKPARTRVSPWRRGESSSLVLCRPETGRTHQIRVHMAHLGHPLLGDKLYGGPRTTRGLGAGHARERAIDRCMLHAAKLSFSHPKTDAPRTFYAPPARDFAILAEQLGVWDECLLADVL